MAMTAGIVALFGLAGERHRTGLLAEAEALYRQVLAADPTHLASLHRLAGIAMGQGRPGDAVVLYGRAVDVQPDEAGTFYRLGQALKASGRLDEAASAYGRAVALDPALAPAHGDLGVVLRALGRLPEAVVACRRAAELEPGLARAWSNLASILRLTGDAAGAEQAGREALAIDPADAAALNTLGLMHQDAGRHAQAAATFERALAADPTFAEAAYNMGLALKDRGRREEAKASFDQALRLRPDLAEARVALCMAELPAIYRDEAEIDERRQAYGRALDGLEAVAPADLARGVGASQPFYLAYQGRDDRELQARYGQLVCRAMAAAHPRPPIARPAAGEAVRIGVISGYFRHHANWRLPIRGWLTGLRGRGLRLFGYHTGALVDDQTAEAQRLCEGFVQGPLSTEAWIERIVADRPHVLIYPEVGMDPVVARLAALRLAPVQCASWGHPSTTGYPTIDYFLSSAAMEPAQADGHYAERLVRLPGLSAAYDPPRLPAEPVSRVALGLRDGAKVYWCGQSLYKYHPRHDDLFPAVAKALGEDCQFVFIEFPGAPELTARFRDRLDAAFAVEGLDARRHLVMLPRLTAARFHAALGLADVVLDSVGWSGCNSLLEALAHDLPIVTCPGQLMRGRHGAAILDLLGLAEIVTQNLEAYVALAARLGRDEGFRADLKVRIGAAKHRLTQDDTPAAVLAQFMEKAARSAS